MKTKWPKTIHVAGRRVKLSFVDLEDTFGQYKHDLKIIEVNRNISDSDKLLTIRHELMEASLLLSGVGFSERYEQEPIVRCMEEIFFPAWDAFVKRITKDNARTYNSV
jgi:Zn-dependent peptidase ImmA (M78 family)